MRAMVTAKSLAATLAGALLALGAAHANEDVQKRIADPSGQVLQTVDYANTRYSRLDPVSYTHLTLPTNREV